MRTSSQLMVAAACGFVALATSAIAVVAAITAGGGHASTLVRMSEDEPMAALAKESDPSFRFVPREAHYDGVYYYAIARDPFATEIAHTKIDLASYRYEHGGYGLLAALVTFGNDKWIPAALLLLNLVGAGVAAAVASIISRDLGASAWGGLVVALNPGIIYSVTTDTGEPVGIALLGLLLLAWARRAWFLVVPLVIGVCLMKETFVLVPIGLVLWEIVRYSRGERGRRILLRSLVLSAGPVALGAWVVYLRGRFGTWPFSESPDLLRFPFTGWGETLREAAVRGVGSGIEQQIGQATVTLLTVSLVLLMIGCWRATRLRTSLDVLFLLNAGALFCLGSFALAFPKDFFRLSTLPFILLAAVLINPTDPEDALRGRSPNIGTSARIAS